MNAWKLAKKDLAVYFRDRAGVLLGLGLPIALATVFGAAMGAMGGSDTLPRAELAVEDLDATDASRALVAALEAQRGLRVSRVEPAEEGKDAQLDRARELVAGGDAPAALVIRKGYAGSVARGESPVLVLYRDPGKEIEQQIVAGNLLPALLAAAGEGLGRRAAGEMLDWIDFPPAARERATALLERTFDDMNALAMGAGGDADGQQGAAADAKKGGAAGKDDEAGFDFASAVGDLLGLEVQDVVGGDQASAKVQKRAVQAHSVSGIAVMMLLFGLTACGGTLLDEEAEGTLDRLRLAPGAGGSLLAGKFLFTWIIGIVQLLVLFLYASVIFDVPILGAPVALLAVSAATAAAATGFGILFAALCRSRKQLEGLSTIVILTMSAMGGSWWPLSMTPAWYQKLGHVTLTAWAMDGYQKIFWYGKGLPAVLLSVGVLLGIALLTGAAAVHFWRRRQRA